MSDIGQSAREQRHVIANAAVDHGITLPNHRAGCDHVRCDRHSSKLIETVNVDQRLWAEDAHVEHGAERLAAGNDAGISAILGERRERLVQHVRTEILEGCRFHRRAHIALSMAHGLRSQARRRPGCSSPRKWARSRLKKLASNIRTMPSSMRWPNAARRPPTSAGIFI